MKMNIAFICNDVARLFRKNFTYISRGLGATGGQWRALLLIKHNPGITQSALAEDLDVEPITACRMVDRLEQAQLVERRKDPSDRRVRQLFLTDAAFPVVDELRTIGAHMLDRATATLSNEEVAQLLELLSRVRENLINFDTDDNAPEALNG